VILCIGLSPAELAGPGLAADLVPSGIATRQTVTVVDTKGSATVLVEPAGMDCWSELVEVATAHATRAEVVVISGSMPSGAPDDAASTLVALAHRAGRPVLVDTSGAALFDALSARPTMIKPNADELGHAGAGGDPLYSARALADAHSTVVIASLGAAGVVAASARGTWRARPARQLTGNSTGAGDALVAGLARGLRNGVSLLDLLPDCVALSAAAVLSPHAGEIDPSRVAEQRAGVLVDAVDVRR
jgi:tagatose 6-phosphate kinase